jgi:hypothetical protein
MLKTLVIIVWVLVYFEINVLLSTYMVVSEVNRKLMLKTLVVIVWVLEYFEINEMNFALCLFSIGEWLWFGIIICEYIYWHLGVIGILEYFEINEMNFALCLFSIGEWLLIWDHHFWVHLLTFRSFYGHGNCYRNIVIVCMIDIYCPTHSCWPI